MTAATALTPDGDPHALSVVEQVLFDRPPGHFWDVDGIELTLPQWLRLVADADYRTLAVHRFTPDETGAGLVTVRTEWAGQELRPVPDLTRQPLIWRTRVTGGRLDGRVWLAARRPTARMLHGHALGAVVETFPRSS